MDRCGVLAVVVFFGVVGCGDAPERPVTTFDPGVVEVGDSVLGLEIAGKDVSRAVAMDSVWVGTVDLAGELRLEGVYQAHFDYPEVPALCFHPSWESAARIPAFHPDSLTSPDRKRWFCFTNPELAIERIGPPDQPREATVVVRDYRVVRRFTDAWETAELVRVEDVGRPRTATLREPAPQPRLMRDSIPTSQPIDQGG